MTERDDTARDPEPLGLREAFPPVPTREWVDVATRDLKGGDYETRLRWRTDEALAVEPFYRGGDLDGLEPQVDAVPGAAPWVRGTGRPWRNLDDAAWPDDAVRADVLHDAGATIVEEVAWAIAEGVDRLAATPEDERRAAAGRLAFVFAVGSTYFLEIAKLRAVRLLWHSAVTAFDPAAPGSATLHVRTARANKSAWDVHTNLLRATTEAMAAVIGGADTLLVEPQGYDPHLALNVPRILAEESHLDAVADPAGGSYLVEVLTDAIARQAWARFQAIESAGGYRAAVDAGLLAAALDETRAARRHAVATRRRTLVGVNAYADAAVTSPSPGPFPDPEGAGPLAPLRLAEPFEALRARTARHAAQSGRRPLVHLVTRGAAARADFCRDLFGCAGFDVTQDEGVGPDADLLVLCSADETWLALASEVAPAAAAPVIVAGRPPDDPSPLRAAGIEGFVHAGIDAVDALGHWQDRLGMAP